MGNQQRVRALARWRTDPFLCPNPQGSAVLVTVTRSWSRHLWPQDGQNVSSLFRNRVNKTLSVAVEYSKTTHSCDIPFEPTDFSFSWGTRPPNEKKHHRFLISSRLRPCLPNVRNVVEELKPVAGEQRV